MQFSFLTFSGGWWVAGWLGCSGGSLATTLLDKARLSLSGGMVGGWVRKAENKAKAQHSWDLAEIGKRPL